MSDIFDDDELKAEATNAEGEVEEGKTDDPPRDESGRFAAKQPDEGDDGGDQGSEEEKPRGDGKVPQGALHAEREKHKATKAELKTVQDKLDAIAKLREQVANRQPDPLPATDDPARTDHLAQRLEQIERNTTQMGQYLDNQELERREFQELSEVMGRSEAEFRQSTPDYDEAITYVVQARARELALYGASQAEINATISQEAADIARVAIKQGRNPAEVGYEIAKLRGYQGQTQQQGGTAQATLDAIERAKAGSKSLSQAAGATPKAINAETILAMSPEEFEALYATEEGRRMIDNL